jgi:hypothetical protein
MKSYVAVIFTVSVPAVIEIFIALMIRTVLQNIIDFDDFFNWIDWRLIYKYFNVCCVLFISQRAFLRLFLLFK